VQQPEVPARGADGRRDYLVANEVEIGRLIMETLGHLLMQFTGKCALSRAPIRRARFPGLRQ
jgi:hypothetical protein